MRHSIHLQPKVFSTNLFHFEKITLRVMLQVFQSAVLLGSVGASLYGTLTHILTPWPKKVKVILGNNFVILSHTLFLLSHASKLFLYIHIQPTQVLKCQNSQMIA